MIKKFDDMCVWLYKNPTMWYISIIPQLYGTYLAMSSWKGAWYIPVALGLPWTIIAFLWLRGTTVNHNRMYAAYIERENAKRREKDSR